MKEKGEMGRDICLAKDFVTNYLPLLFLLSKYLFASKQIAKAEQRRNGFALTVHLRESIAEVHSGGYTIAELIPRSHLHTSLKAFAIAILEGIIVVIVALRPLSVGVALHLGFTRNTIGKVGTR